MVAVIDALKFLEKKIKTFLLPDIHVRNVCNICTTDCTDCIHMALVRAAYYAQRLLSITGCTTLSQLKDKNGIQMLTKPKSGIKFCFKTKTKICIFLKIQFGRQPCLAHRHKAICHKAICQRAICHKAIKSQGHTDTRPYSHKAIQP